LIDASEAPVSPAPDASSSDPGLVRLSGLFFSPVATLESIARRPTWVAPRLFVIGFAAAARVKRGPAAGVIVTLWLLTVAIRVGWNAIF